MLGVLLGRTAVNKRISDYGDVNFRVTKQDNRAEQFRRQGTPETLSLATNQS